ncbi:hypothetical protein [Acinetobacter sp. yr461]|jgi:hypothetical protein|uniref:hypothetical protein n=1 Tax=Acinetobacter sp. yr461 TaxID=1761742 RepID=UPI000B80708F|nr:hypothetical protein [Acinetobacter sp. yr461]
MTAKHELIAFGISILITVLIPVLMLKYWALKKSAFFSCLTWFLLFSVTGEYFRLLDHNTRDLADIWFLFAIGYMTVFEYGDWIDYEKLRR